MAIAFSAPVSTRRRRVRGESTARSTGIKTSVSFPELSLESQLLYLALLETWRVVRMMVEEQTGVVYQEEGGETGLLMEDILTDLEDMDDCPETDEVDTKIGGVQIMIANEENNKRSRDNLPDLIRNMTKDLDRPVTEPAPLPDLLSSCSPGSGRRSSCHCSRNTTNIGRDPRSSNPNNRLSTPPPHDRKELAPEELAVWDASRPVPPVQPCQSADITLPVPAAPPRQSLNTSPPVPSVQPRQSAWAKIGKQLDRIAGETRQADRGSRNERQRGGPTIDSSGLAASSLRGDSPYSDLLSTVAICGLSYLVRRIFK